ncbi:MAG: glycine cleavage system protein GcvH [Halobacteriales archaeon]|nr:glycine cleavage system protein GcvH [Halobacteriales archaeon]
MSYETPDDRRYLESHEWVHTDGGTAQVGISDFAQDELGDVVFVELPAVGDEVARDEQFGVIESIKAVSDLYSPVSGTVTAVNDALEQEPELVNESPYGDGWLFELELADEGELEGLLSADEYAGQVE